MGNSREPRIHAPDAPGWYAYGYCEQTGTAMSLIAKKSYDHQRKRKGGAQRGDIEGYSAASKRRLRRTIWSVPWTTWSEASFVTLTYPEQFPDVRQAKRDLVNWFANAQRNVDSKAWAIWAREIQKRGAPHFHLIMSWRPFAHSGYRGLQHFLSCSWADTVGKGRQDPKHLKAGTNMKPVRDVKILGDYISKPGSKMVREIGKGIQRPDQKHGRYWGVLNRKEFRKCQDVRSMNLARRASWKAWLEVQQEWEKMLNVIGKDVVHLPEWTENPELIDRIIEESSDRTREQNREDLATTGEQMRLPKVGRRERTGTRGA